MRFFFTFLSLLSTLHAAALPYKHLVITLNGGPAWARPFQAQVLSQYQNVYEQVSIGHTNIQTLGFGELFISSEYPFYKSIQGQFGAAISGAGNASSNIMDTINSTQHQNNYELVQYRVAFRAKWFTELKRITPYITTSVGAGFTALHPSQSIDINKTSIQVIENNAYSVPYTFGAGIQHNIHSHWVVGIGYEYYNWGNADVNPNNGFQGLKRIL